MIPCDVLNQNKIAEKNSNEKLRWNASNLKYSRIERLS